MKIIQELIRIETQRYKKKGIYNVIIAISLLILVICSAQKLGQHLWPQQISYSNNNAIIEYLFLVGWSLVIHTTCLFLCLMVYLPGYLNCISCYEKFRINKAKYIFIIQNSLNPWQKSDWSMQMNKTTKYLFINYAIIYPMIITISLLLTGLKVRFDNFPSKMEIAFQLFFISLIQDCCFYWAHRFSHQSSWLYKFHKTHHEYQTVFSLVTEYTHPVDYIIGIMIPSAAGFVFLGSSAHCFMLFFWQVWKMFISNQGHSGYQFPWSPTRIFFFVSGPSYHDFHHAKNAGNYCGSIYLWDYFNGSNKQYMSLFMKNKLE